MKQYKKPLMKIVELEKVDVLTCSVCEGVENYSHTDADGCAEGCQAHSAWSNSQTQS